MSAARAIPLTEATVWTVTIDNTYTPTPQAFIIQPGDQVNFVNNSGSTIAIAFDTTSQPQSFFSNIPSILNGGNYVTPQTPDLNGSQLYGIYVGGVKQSGPFCIQVGTGPLYIVVTNGVTLPDSATIPVNGTLRILDSANDPWTVEWDQNGQPVTNNPFNPPLTTVGSHQIVAGAGEYTYSLSPADPKGGDGGGTIKVTN
jgi:hypothetical protein